MTSIDNLVGFDGAADGLAGFVGAADGLAGFDGAADGFEGLSNMTTLAFGQCIWAIA